MYRGPYRQPARVRPLPGAVERLVVRLRRTRRYLGMRSVPFALLGPPRRLVRFDVRRVEKIAMALAAAGVAVAISVG